MIEALNKLSKDELISEVLNQKYELLQKQNHIELLKHQVGIFQKAMFGSKKETHQVLVNPEQTQLEFSEKIDLDLPQDIAAQKVSYQRKATNTKRTDYSKLELPADLERVETVIEPLDKTEGMTKIGEEVTELLAIAPQKFYVKRIIRPKYARPNNEGISIAELPSRPVQGGKVDVSLLVMILLDKYVDHLPLHRQLKKYERLGVKLSDATVGSWAGEAIKPLEYLYQELKTRVKNSSYLQADETPIKVLDKDKKGTTHRGYYWVYHDVENGLVLYEYDPSRGQTPPTNFLSDYKGYLQTDGYSVYDALTNKQLKLAGCMAHARRYFFDAKENDKARAIWLLDKLQELYAIEQTARENKYSHAQRLALRQQSSLPVLQEIKQWLNKNQLEVLPKSPIGKAINYANTRWDKLCLFASNGILEIDNNLIENAIRPIALGRKNYLFAGSHQSASRAGIIYSFITCCKKNNIDPYKWLEETLTKISDTKKSQLYTLLPIKKQDVVE